jgi:uncharacterized protein YjdB
MKKGAVIKAGAKVMPTNATNKKLNWTSSNPKIAKVYPDGKILALSPGIARITAKSVNSNVRAVVVIKVIQ